MRSALTLVAPLVAGVFTMSALAGGPDCDKAAKAAQAASAHKPCPMSAADCKKSMAEMKNYGWLGLELEKGETDGALVVKKVVPQSPASVAGFEVGDVLVAVNGVAYTEANEARLKEVKKDLKPGSQATWTIRRDGAERSISARLGQMPDEVYTAYVSEHMKEHAAVAQK